MGILRVALSLSFRILKENPEKKDVGKGQKTKKTSLEG